MQIHLPTTPAGLNRPEGPRTNDHRRRLDEIRQFILDTIMGLPHSQCGYNSANASTAACIFGEAAFRKRSAMGGVPPGW